MPDYKVIDLNTYPRRAHLEYFMSMERPQVNITVNVDVTELLSFCKRENYPFFLSFLHVVALSADEVPQLRQRIHRLTEEELRQQDSSKMVTEGTLAGIEIREYTESPTSHTETAGNEMYCYCSLYHHMPWKEYISSALRLQQDAREKASLEEDEEIEAFYFPTCVPWLHYSELVHPMTDRYDSNPRFSWGKYEEDFKGRLMMPLTVAFHHGLVDGIHIAGFYNNIGKNIKALIEEASR